jgi:hypothetical protein
VAAGDEVRVFEFENGQTRLAAELTADEMTWSRSIPVAFDQVKAWFGTALRADAMRGQQSDNMPDSVNTRKFMLWILGLNAIPLLLNFGGSFTYVALALLAIYLPARFFASGAKGKP